MFQQKYVVLQENCHFNPGYADNNVSQDSFIQPNGLNPLMRPSMRKWRFVYILFMIGTLEAPTGTNTCISANQENVEQIILEQIQ